MDYVNLRTVVEQGIKHFRRNRSASQTPVSITIPASLSSVPWPDRRFKQFIRRCLCQCLSISAPDAAIEVMAKRQAHLKGLDNFIGVRPSYWLEFRLSGVGFRMAEVLVEELLGGLDYRCEEWVGTEASGTRLGIFAYSHSPDQKIVIFLDSSQGVVNCDFLFPIHETYSFSPSLKHTVKTAAPRA